MSLNRSAFDAEIVRCQPKLRAAARGLCSRQANPEDTALDLLQIANLRALERHDQFCGGSLLGWAFQIMRNAFRDHLRRLKTREHEQLFTDLATRDEDGEYTDPEYADVGDPHSKLEAAEAFEAISRMPERTAGALLQAGVGATCTEIAASLSLTEANVRKLLERGRLELRLTLSLQA